MTDWIKDKVAIVTGGGSGIGQAIAIEAASKGAKVVIADINESGAHDTIQSIKSIKGFGKFCKTDVTKSDSIKSLVEKSKSLGPIKFLANSAGLQTYGTAESTSEDEWDKTMDVNLKSMFLMIQQTIPEIKQNSGGSIVNISSVQAFRCQRNVLAYSTSKAAVVAMTRSMGLDYAHEGISVNCICPGSVNTPMLQFGAAQHGKIDEVLNEWATHHPIGRIGTPQEVAKTCLFLWSPDSNFIVGQSIVADGGLGSVIL